MVILKHVLPDMDTARMTLQLLTIADERIRELKKENEELKNKILKLEKKDPFDHATRVAESSYHAT
jgi:hypothetical protein